MQTEKIELNINELHNLNRILSKFYDCLDSTYDCGLEGALNDFGYSEIQFKVNQAIRKYNINNPS